VRRGPQGLSPPRLPRLHPFRFARPVASGFRLHSAMFLATAGSKRCLFNAWTAGGWALGPSDGAPPTFRGTLPGPFAASALRVCVCVCVRVGRRSITVFAGGRHVRQLALGHGHGLAINLGARPLAAVGGRPDRPRCCGGAPSGPSRYRLGGGRRPAGVVVRASWRCGGCVGRCGVLRGALAAADVVPRLLGGVGRIVQLLPVRPSLLLPLPSSGAREVP